MLPQGITSGSSLEEHCTEDELPALLQVLQFAYTGKLEPYTDVTLLCQMAARAYAWDMESCALACLQQLSAALTSPHATFAQLSCLLTTLPEGLIYDSKWRSLVAHALLHMFGMVRNVIANDTQLKLFCTLPFGVVHTWAGLDQLAVDDEASVAVLLTAWYLHQATSTTRPTDEQCKQLSALVRLSQLSPSFMLQVLERLPWWRLPTGLESGFAAWGALLQLTANKDCNLKGMYGPRQAAMLARQADTGLGQLTWQLSLEKLQSSFDTGCLLSPRLYLAGWEWDCVVRWRDVVGVPGSKTLGMFMQAHPPACLALGNIPGMAATAKVTTCMDAAKHEYGIEIFKFSGWGECDMLRLSVSDVARDLAPHMQAGKLHLSFDVSTVQ